MVGEEDRGGLSPADHLVTGGAVEGLQLLVVVGTILNPDNNGIKLVLQCIFPPLF